MRGVLRRRLRMIAGLPFGVALCALVSCLSCTEAPAQTPLAPAPDVLYRVAPAVSDSLARAWDDTSPAQPERGYCLAHATDTTAGGMPEVRLTALVRPDSVWAATPYQIGIHCPGGAYVLHTHTPTTCPMLTPWDHDLRHCRIGGPDAWLCYPSIPDRLSLTARGDPVAFVQCDRRGIVPYTPYHLPRGS